MSVPARTLVEAVRRRARTAPAQVAVRYLVGDGGGTTLTVTDLDRASRAVAASLSDVTPGERALLLYPPGPDFAAALLGCLYARIVPVPRRLRTTAAPHWLSPMHPPWGRSRTHLSACRPSR
jgi:acyl-CoA synthetase (AMP-forming)/AMP-acid ligase II